MAGNRPRALQLYRNFVRLYGDNPRAEDARNHARRWRRRSPRAARAARGPRAGVDERGQPATGTPSPAWRHRHRAQA